MRLGLSSERLPQGEMKLELGDPLVHGHSLTGQQLIPSPRESKKTRRIGTETEIYANRAHRRTVAHAKAQTVHHVIEVRQIPLTKTQADLPDIGVDVAHVV